MNNVKLLIFALLIFIVGTLIHLKKGQLFALLAPSQTQFTTQVTGEGFSLTLKDPSGIQYTLVTPPQRLLSATLVTDHILSDLMPVAEQSSRLIAVSEYVDYPSLSNLVGFYDKSISRTQGEIESMLALQPDLVFVASYSNSETVRYLLRSGIAVVRLSEFKAFDDIINNIRLVAKVTDTQVKAEQVIHNLQNRITFIKEQVKDLDRPRVLYYDLNGYSVGGDSLMNEAIEVSGGINVVKDVISNGEQKISEELAISLQPEVIIMNKWVFNQSQGQQSPADILKNKKAWKNVPAVINHQVYAVPGTWLRSVSQHRIKGVEAIASLLHPNIATYSEALHEQHDTKQDDVKVSPNENDQNEINQIKEDRNKCIHKKMKSNMQNEVDDAQ